MINQKIIFISSFAESLIWFRLHLIKEFLQRKYTVVVMAPFNEKVANELSQMGVKFIPIQMDRNGRNPLRDIWLIMQLFLLIKREKPTIVLSYNTKPVIYGSIAAKFAGVANIYALITGAGYIFLKTNLKTRFIGFIARKLFRYALQCNKHLFFQNKDNVISFIDHHLLKKNQGLTIVNGSGVDIDAFSLTPLPKQLSFLMIARLIYTKGVREYAQAAQTIKYRYPHTSFRLAGWIDTYHPNAITQQELSKWVEDGYIEFLGMLSDVRDAISNATVYVLPSYEEGMPRTVLEAMAMGRPIITTDVPGCRETVVNRLNGFLIPVRDVDALCSAIEYFIHQSSIVEKMGKKSRNIATEKYDVHKVNTCILRDMNIDYISS